MKTVENVSFICRIYGMKNDSEVEHFIKIICCDGFVTIEDEWIKNYYELKNK